MTTDNLTVTLYKGSPVTTQDLGLWQGDIVTMLPECKTPSIRWTGAPIPAHFFGQMLGFFRHVYDKWGSEAMVRLAYNKAERQWRMVCYPQTIKQGMEIKEIKDLTDEQKAIRDRMLAALGDGYMENGSSHSHCNMSAFQSGTDLANELKNTGVHITLGNINSERPSVHGRVSFRGIMYPINWAEWFEGWPADMKSRVDEFQLVPGADLSFPQEWLECCFEPPPAPVYTGFNHWSSSDSTTSRTSWHRSSHRSSYWNDDDVGESEFGIDNPKFQAKKEDKPFKDIYQSMLPIAKLPANIAGPSEVEELVDYLVQEFGAGYYLSRDEELFRTVAFSHIDNEPGLGDAIIKDIQQALAFKQSTNDPTPLDYEEVDAVLELFERVDQIIEVIHMIHSDNLSVPVLVDVLSQYGYTTT